MSSLLVEALKTNNPLCDIDCYVKRLAGRKDSR